MSDDKIIKSVAPKEGANIVDRDTALSDPQRRVADPKIVGGTKDMRKEGVQVVKQHND